MFISISLSGGLLRVNSVFIYRKMLLSSSLLERYFLLVIEHTVGSMLSSDFRAAVEKLAFALLVF